MKFVAVDNEKFVEMTSKDPKQFDFTVEFEAESVKDLIKKVKFYKPNAKSVEVTVTKNEKPCDIAGVVVMTNTKVYVNILK